MWKEAIEQFNLTRQWPSAMKEKDIQKILYRIYAYNKSSITTDDNLYITNICLSLRNMLNYRYKHKCTISNTKESEYTWSMLNNIILPRLTMEEINTHIKYLPLSCFKSNSTLPILTNNILYKHFTSSLPKLPNSHLTYQHIQQVIFDKISEEQSDSHTETHDVYSKNHVKSSITSKYALSSHHLSIFTMLMSMKLSNSNSFTKLFQSSLAFIPHDLSVFMQELAGHMQYYRSKKYVKQARVQRDRMTSDILSGSLLNQCNYKSLLYQSVDNKMNKHKRKIALSVLNSLSAFSKLFEKNNHIDKLQFFVLKNIIGSKLGQWFHALNYLKYHRNSSGSLYNQLDNRGKLELKCLSVSKDTWKYSLKTFI